MKKSSMINLVQAESDDNSDDAPSFYSKKDVSEPPSLGFTAE
jgi:hypothetical protein